MGCSATAGNAVQAQLELNEAQEADDMAALAATEAALADDAEARAKEALEAARSAGCDEGRLQVIEREKESGE